MIDFNFSWEMINLKLQFHLDGSFDLSSQKDIQDYSQILNGMVFDSANVFGSSLRSGVWKGIRIHTGG